MEKALNKRGLIEVGAQQAIAENLGYNFLFSSQKICYIFILCFAILSISIITSEIMKYLLKCLENLLFGIALFKLIEDCHEEVCDRLAFYRATTHQNNDVYAVCSNKNNSCAIQLDPDTEVICLWNKTVRTEITSWSENPEHEALEFLLENLACST